MLRALRDRLTYANVTATLALFIALGGSSYAALQITGKQVRDHSLTGRDIKKNSIRGRQVKERSFGVVPRARNAARLGGLPARRLPSSTARRAPCRSPMSASRPRRARPPTTPAPQWNAREPTTASAPAGGCPDTTS